MQRKLLDYLNYGARLVWYVYPETQTVTVHTPDGSHTLGATDTLEGGGVLPGFSSKVSELFPK